nr:hypothetical membrane protein [uncultured archaeon]
MKGKGGSSKRILDLLIAGAGISVLLVLTAIAFTSIAIVPATAQSVEVRVIPESGYAEEGATFSVAIDVDEVTNFKSGQFDLSFDSDVLKVTDVTAGSIGGKTTRKPKWWNEDAGTVVAIIRMPLLGETANGSGHLAKVTFKVKGEEGDTSVLDLSSGKLSDTRAMEFSIEGKFKDELNDEEISEELKEIFKGNGCPLENPTVKVIKKDEKWKIIDRRVYLVMVKDNELKIRDTGEILAKWVDAEIKVGQEEEEEEEEGEEPTPTPTLAPGVTPTPETNVTVTPSPTPTLAPGVTPSPTLAPRVIPTPKPAATTSPVAKPKPTPTPTPKPAVPGFEAIFAIVGILSIAYILQRRR